ncbi:phosphoglyceromutase [Thalassovita gelatinovora]|uniref:phosphoglycerate mutase (2,3-diphosphoglycerate-dependent) n=1 Tax=Thalassovita gelatinovora TaxID=53501 RepID=A0A0P1F9B4_THAGE|nr:histidine phosphatase family protein [Thalassovita gelatinovora]QIZ81184.1 histidine phosphatase family protein [Thalassovita gelatinovora]CUH64755.1 phosphoglyceromutase [Thalassovita gelatinovora]SEP92552.1 2,3-bisphosphoglycerate-dependent phosphoglycerate mutase [Thalassovita gelatinovora]
MSGRIVALIRHGAYDQRHDTPSALQPYPLTETGIAQARTCGDGIARLLDENGWRLDPVAHSSLQLRAWQTAQTVAETLTAAGHDLTIGQTPDLSERALGSAANLTIGEIEEVLRADPRFDTPPPGWKADRDYRLPLHGAESLGMAGARVAAWLRDLVAQPASAELPLLTLVFGHGAAFRHAAHDLGVLTLAEIAGFSMYHARPLLLCYRGNDTWVQCGGAWKPRRRQETALD